MWSLLGKKTQIALILAAGLLAGWTIDAVLALTLHRNPGVLKTLSLAVTVVGTVFVAGAEASWRWLWRRAPVLSRRAFPDLNGKWVGTLNSTWISPETTEKVEPISAQITIRQGLFTTSVSLKTDESESHSTRCILERLSEIGRFRVWYTYKYEPAARDWR